MTDFLGPVFLFPLTMTIEDDSWSAIFKPPLNESLQQRQERIARQQEATRISQEIDDAIEKSRKQLEKRNKAIKVLLLGTYIHLILSTPSPLLTGQAESGKSTMLRSTSLPHSLSPFSHLSRLSVGVLSKLLSSRDSRLEGHHTAQPHRVRPSPISLLSLLTPPSALSSAC